MFSKETYQQRRNKLKETVKKGVILLPGNSDTSMNYPSNPFRFRQDSSFLYFTGLDLQNLFFIIDIDNNEEYLFGDDIGIDSIIWMGTHPTIAELAEKSGIPDTHQSSRLNSIISNFIQKGRKIHFLPPYRKTTQLLLESLTGIKSEFQHQYASEEFIRAVVGLRSVKERQEVEQIEKAADTAWIMHTTAMKMANTGVGEREIAGTIEGIAIAGGGMLSFPSIVSVHGQTLHNHNQVNVLKTGDMLLVDSGAETQMHYASDFTRTTPVEKKFSEIQRDIYEIVLHAQLSAIKMIEPGIAFFDIHMHSARVLANGLKDLGLMKGDTEEAIKKGAHALFMPHGLGHMMGLDVHDMEGLGEDFVGYDDKTHRSTIFGTAFLRLGRELQKGFVLTVEPGCYFIPALIDQWKSQKKHEAFINYEKVEKMKSFGGIRIEDDLLVTEDGHRLLGKPIPKTVAEIESMPGKELP